PAMGAPLSRLIRVDAELRRVRAEEHPHDRREAVGAAAHAARLQRLVDAVAQPVADAIQLLLDLAGLEELQRRDPRGGDERRSAVRTLVGDALGSIALGITRE